MADRTILKKIPKMSLLFLIVFTIFTGCAMVHTYGSYYGKVVDIETKEPLEGAAVLAVYNTQQYGVAGPVTYYVDAQETVTDKKGEFKIPSNTVFTFRPLSSFEPFPTFRIFKPEYGCFPEHKDVKKFKPWWSLPVDEYVTIELPRLKTREERVENQRCEPISISKDKYRRFLEIINYERIDLGLEPVPIK